MKRSPAAFLGNIQQACEAPNAFVHGRDCPAYERDLMQRSAVERQRRTIGETLARLSRVDTALTARVPRHRQLTGFRSVLLHGYAGPNDAESWRAVLENLPERLLPSGLCLKS